MRLEKAPFLLGVIFSPPLGGAYAALEDYYQTQIKPFITLLYRYPHVVFTLHFSGEILDWLQSQHPEALDVTVEMIRRRQVELLGGGYFAPILAMIPPQDRLGQIEELTTTLRKHLGKRPRGCWLEKGIWDQSLVTNLAASGMEFTFLDAELFALAGLDLGDQPYGLTEYQGRTLGVFPFQKAQAQAWEAGEIRELPPGKAPLYLIFPRESWDGSDFFRNPEGLEHLLQQLQTRQNEWEPTLPSNLMKKPPLSGIIYFPTSLEPVLSHLQSPWDQRLAPRGHRTYRHGLGAFPEIRSLYSKMVFIHLLVHSIRGDKYKKKSVLEDLWKAQHRLGYFHWAEGGSSNPLHRRRAYSHLIHAERGTRDPSLFQSFLSSQDYNLDSMEEYIFQGRHFNFAVSPQGGQLFEWDCLDLGWNYLDVLDLSTGKLGACGQDLFFTADGQDQTSDLPEKIYKLVDLNREQKSLEFTAKTEITTDSGRIPLRVVKAYRFREHGLEIDWVLEPLAGWEGSFVFATRLDLAFREPEAPGLEILPGDLGLTCLDHSLNHELRWRWDHPHQLQTQTLYTPDPLVPGLQHYQGHRMEIRWNVKLTPGEVWKNTLRLDIVPI